MADPITLGGIGLGSSAAGGILGALGAKQTGEAQAQMYGYQSGVAQMQQRLALQNRDFALIQGSEEATRFGFAAGQRSGAIRVAQAASGLDVGGKTARDVRASQRLTTEIDMRTIANNAARKAYGYEVEAEVSGKQAEMYNVAASNVRKAIPRNMASSLISGVSSVSSKWLQGNQIGIWG